MSEEQNQPAANTSELSALLGEQAAEIAAAGYNGWGNTMIWAKDEIERLRKALQKLVENNVTYWDSKGEVRHDVGTSQAEAMAIFREARQLLTPNKE